MCQRAIFLSELLTIDRKYVYNYYLLGKDLFNVVSEDKMEGLGKKVRELREKKDWAQEDLAREIDVSLSTVQRWEKQGAKPTRLARRELARLFQEAGIGTK